MKMNLFYSVSFMIVASFVIQYYLMSIISVYNINDITNSLGKFYISSIMAIMMGLLEVFMYDFTNKFINWNYYFILLLFILIFYLLYKMSIGINDKEYLKEMIEHHSMAIQNSIEIENSSSNYKIKKLANNIISSQSDQIEYMKNLVKNIN